MFCNKIRNLPTEKNLIDLDNFSKIIGTSIIWIAYMFHYNDSEEYKKLYRSLNEENFNLEEFRNLIHIISVDIGNKLYYKVQNSKIIKENILFGEINLD